jgi:type III pantothenate kinase
MTERYVLDVGNTTAAFALFTDGDVINPQRMATNLIVSLDDFSPMFNNAITSESHIVACVGVPRVADLLREYQQQVGCSLSFIDGRHLGGANVIYETPHTLGADRIANTVAVLKQDFVPCVVIDCGTAITIDVVNSDREFIGGLIAPGLETSRNALLHYAPTLPEVDLVAPIDIVGTNTVMCIQSGVMHGAAAMIDNVLEKLHRHYGITKYVLTGGHAPVLFPLLHSDVVLDEWLTLKGLGVATSPDSQ